MKYIWLFLFLLMSWQLGFAQNDEQNNLGYAYEEGNDTIPIIYIDDTTLTYPNLFEGSFQPNTWVKQWGLNIEFFPLEIGKLKIHSGKLIAGDPAELFSTTPFKYDFPKGEYPVEVAIARMPQIDRIGFARIRFSNEQVNKWKFAVEAGDMDTLVVGEDYYGYETTSSLWTFIDSTSAHYLNEMNIYKYWKNVILANIGDNQAKHIIQLPFPYEYTNLAVMETGMGNGYYSTYIGLDAKGKICQLLVDFEIVNWWYVEE